MCFLPLTHGHNYYGYYIQQIIIKIIVRGVPCTRQTVQVLLNAPVVDHLRLTNLHHLKSSAFPLGIRSVVRSCVRRQSGLDCRVSGGTARVSPAASHPTRALSRKYIIIDQLTAFAVIICNGLRDKRVSRSHSYSHRSCDLQLKSRGRVLSSISGTKSVLEDLIIFFLFNGKQNRILKNKFLSYL